MAKHRSKAEVRAIVKAIDKQRAKGVPVSDCCKAQGIAEQCYYRWRCAVSADSDDTARRLRDLTSEVERLRQALVDAMLDNQMLREVAKKSGEWRPTAVGGGLAGERAQSVGASRGANAGPQSIDAAVRPANADRRGAVGHGIASIGDATSAFRLSPLARAVGPRRLDGEREAGPPALPLAGVATA